MNDLGRVGSESPNLWKLPRIQRLIAGFFGLIVLGSIFTVFDSNSALGDLFFLFVGITLLELSYCGGPVRTAVATSLGSYLGMVLLYSM